MDPFYPSHQQTNQNDNNMWQAAAIQGGSNIIGAGITAGANAAIAKRQRRWAELQSDKQYSRQIEQRDYANWYNSPDNQRQLLIDAGMNPNLAYGSGSTQSGLPRPEQARGEFPKVGPINLDPLGAIAKHIGTKKAIAETDKVSKEVQAQTIKNDILHHTKGFLIEQQEAKLKLQLSKATTEADRQSLLKQQKLLAVERTAYEKERAKFAKQGVFTHDNVIWRQAFQKGGQVWEWFKENMLPDEMDYDRFMELKKEYNEGY